MTVARFPAYRRHEAARIEANNAMMALLVAARLGRHTLGLHEGADLFLPEVFPAVPGVQRLNRKVADVRSMLDDAERHLAYMAIPFALSVHHQYALKCLQLLGGPGGPIVPLDQVHERLREQGCTGLPRDETDLFDVARRLRNRILHYAGVAGSADRSHFEQQISDTARGLWERRAGRALSITPGAQLSLGAGELFAVLAVAKRLADLVDEGMQTALPRPAWASMVVDDYAASSPRGIKQPQVARRLIGFARRMYSGVELTSDELATALLDRRNQKEGSSS